MKAPVKFLGIQPAPSPLRPMELYNLTAAISGHPAGSTVTRRDLERDGWEIPADEDAKAKNAWHTWYNAAMSDDHTFPVLGGAVKDLHRNNDIDTQD